MRFLSLSSDDIKATRVINIDPPSLLNLAVNAVFVTRSWHSVSATGTRAQRSLRTIAGGTAGDLLVLQKDAASPGNVIIDDNAGNIQSAGNFKLNKPKDKIAFIYDGTSWCELFRSNN